MSTFDLNSQNTTRKLAIFIFTFALIVRFIFLLQFQNIPTFDNPVMDEKYHMHLIEQINSDEGLPNEPFFRAPLYPYLLSIFWKITNNSYFGIRVIQIFLGSLIPLFLFLLGRKLFSQKIAFIAGLITACYPTLIYYDNALLITFLITLFSVMLLYALYRTEDITTIYSIVIGIMLGLAGLARPNILLFGPFLFLWFWVIVKTRIGTKKAMLQYLILGITTIVIILPVTIRNYVVSGDPIFIAWQGGINFYIGNNNNSTGWSATLPGIDKSWEGGYTESIALAEQEMNRKLKRSEVSSFWFNKTFENISQHKESFLSLILKKMRLIVNGYEIPNNQNIYLAKDYSIIADFLLWQKVIYFPYGILIPFALVGIGYSLKNWRKFLPVYLFLFAYGLSLILFFVCARFRQPMIPIFILFAVYGLFELSKQIKARDYKNLMLVFLALLLIGIESNHDMLGLKQARVKAEDYHLIGSVYLEQNNLPKAESAFKMSVRADSSFGRGYNNLGLIYGRRADYRNAEINFRKAIAHNPDIVESYTNFATVMILKGDFEQAIQILLNTAQAFPLNDLVMMKVGLTYYQMNDLDNAKIYLQKAIRLNPNNMQAQDAFNQIRQMNP